MGIQLLWCVHKGERIVIDNVTYDVYVKDVGFHVLCEQTQVFPLASF
jgi:hypothetical protein